MNEFIVYYYLWLNWWYKSLRDFKIHPQQAKNALKTLIKDWYLDYHKEENIWWFIEGETLLDIYMKYNKVNISLNNKNQILENKISKITNIIVDNCKNG